MLLTYLVIYLLTLLTLLTYLLASLFTYLLAYSLTCLIAYLLNCLLAYLLTCFLAFSLACLLAYLLTYLLTFTPWSRALLEKLTGFQLVNKFPAFYGTQRFTYLIHKCQPPVPILSQLDPVHTLTFHFKITC